MKNEKKIKICSNDCKPHRHSKFPKLKFHYNKDRHRHKLRKLLNQLKSYRQSQNPKKNLRVLGNYVAQVSEKAQKKKREKTECRVTFATLQRT